MTMVDFSKPVQTREGGQVKLYTTNGVGLQVHHGGNFSIHGIYWRVFESEWRLACWRPDGRFYRTSESPYDLVNIPEPLPTACGWMVWWSDGSYCLFCGPRKPQISSMLYNKPVAIKFFDNMSAVYGEGLD